LFEFIRLTFKDEEEVGESIHGSVKELHMLAYQLLLRFYVQLKKEEDPQVELESKK